MQRSQRLSQMLFVTLREDPAEAELISHKLLLRGGFIRRLSPGIYGGCRSSGGFCKRSRTSSGRR